MALLLFLRRASLLPAIAMAPHVFALLHGATMQLHDRPAFIREGLRAEQMLESSEAAGGQSTGSPGANMKGPHAVREAGDADWDKQVTGVLDVF